MISVEIEILILIFLRYYSIHLYQLLGWFYNKFQWINIFNCKRTTNLVIVFYQNKISNNFFFEICNYLLGRYRTDAMDIIWL